MAPKAAAAKPASKMAAKPKAATTSKVRDAALLAAVLARSRAAEAAVQWLEGIYASLKMAERTQVANRL